MAATPRSLILRSLFKHMQQTLKGFVADHFGDFSPSDIPNFLFALFLSAILNLLLTMLYKRYGKGAEDDASGKFVLLGLGAATLTAIIKQSLPLALASIALLSIIRIRDTKTDLNELSYLFISILIGVACGAGYGLIMVMAFCVIALFIVIMGRKRKD